MELNSLKDGEHIILDCVSGSRAYGLATPTSDTDIKGVFLLPKVRFYGLEYTRQVSNASNDIVYYELGRFMELLSMNNPNILELLNTPEEHVRFKHDALKKIRPETVLSKLCKDTFGKFALSQIKKAKGLKKKIVNPMAKERKSVLEFCYVNYMNGSLPLSKFLEQKSWNQANCGLVKISNMHNMYGLYYCRDESYKGIIQTTESNDISLSSIPKGEKQQTLLFFNKNGYSSYCKEYREYWEWVEKRNDVRYENTKSHGKNYDAKNMMHTFRLLDMAIEIAKEGQVNVHRPNRAFLLEVKSGKFEYDHLLELANEKQREMDEAFDSSTLPDRPDQEVINRLSFEIRNELYERV